MRLFAIKMIGFCSGRLYVDDTDYHKRKKSTAQQMWNRYLPCDLIKMIRLTIIEVNILGFASVSCRQFNDERLQEDCIDSIVKMCLEFEHNIIVFHASNVDGSILDLDEHYDISFRRHHKFGDISRQISNMAFDDLAIGYQRIEGFNLRNVIHQGELTLEQMKTLRENDKRAVRKTIFTAVFSSLREQIHHLFSSPVFL